MADRTEIHHRRQELRRRQRARRETEQALHRLGVMLVALVVLMLIGTFGFVITEGVSPAFGFHWTLDTIATVGSIPDPPDGAGQVLKVFLEVLGIGTLFYGLVTLAEYFVTGQLSGVIDERRTQRMIDSYSDHFIICGFGRVGRQVARDLTRAGVKHLVVDHNPDNREAAEEVGVAFIEREAADDEVLQHAGIARARGVIACVDSDSENIFIALTARELRDDILIIARASREESEKKLLRAGADRVISPYKTSGHEMARVALHPQVGVAVEVADYRMEEIDVPANSEGVGRTIADVRGTSMIVALRRTDGWLETQPDPATVIGAGDSLVALGTPDALERLEGIFQPATAAKP